MLNLGRFLFNCTEKTVIFNFTRMDIQMCFALYPDTIGFSLNSLISESYSRNLDIYGRLFTIISQPQGYLSQISESRKKAKVKATVVKILQQAQANVASTAVWLFQVSKQRKIAAEDKLERSDQLQNIYCEELHFNFIKIYLLAHFTTQVKCFGNIPSYSMGEVSHCEQIKVEYRASNKVNYTKDILKHCACHQTVALHIMGI